FRLYFLLLRLPHRITLFPYTTLFRSGDIGITVSSHLGLHSTIGPTAKLVIDCKNAFSDDFAVTQRGESISGLFKRIGPAHIRLEDRKSTRLNSSHVKISYAVFCLKKK